MAISDKALARIEAELKSLAKRKNRELDHRLFAITGSHDPKVHQTWTDPVNR